MQPRNGAKIKCKPDNSIPVDQCALYSIGSPKRLAKIIGVSTNDLQTLLESKNNYKIFEICQSRDPFTQKSRKKRLVQEPKPKLRQIHNRLLRLLRRVKYPDYVHGGVKSRSYQTNAAAHKASRQVATFDISDFYSSTKYHRIYDFFHDIMRCPPDISGRLSRLVSCNDALPTGSPISPLLSFWVAKGFFDECFQLAERHKLIFTCYIDDLTFSGDRIPKSLRSEIKIIARRHGFELAKKKTRLFRFGQPAQITGVISLNGQLLVPFKRLQAARKVTDAINGTGPDFGYSRKELKRKLAGMIGEASTIEDRFEKWAAYTREAVDS